MFTMFWTWTLQECVYIRIVRSLEIIRRLKKEGWREVSRKGSHVKFKHPDKPEIVVVPHPKSEIPIGTLRSIEKQAGWR
jgi:predicted RNA binding protein YcfA (HicA-like mRNA interferase family)